MSTITREEVDEAGERVEFRQSTFHCRYCYAGGEMFTEVFSEGSCNKCGGPAGAVVEISRPEDIQTIKESVLLVYDEADKDKAKVIAEEMAANGVNVIDPQTVAANEQAGNMTNVLAFLVDTAKFTLIIPSKKLSSNPLVTAAVESALMAEKENIANIYPDQSYEGRGSTGFLETRYGVVWQDKSPMRAMGKGRFLDFLKKK